MWQGSCLNMKKIAARPMVIMAEATSGHLMETFVCKEDPEMKELGLKIKLYTGLVKGLIRERLSAVCMTGEYSDLFFHCLGGTVACHRLVLAGLSDHLKNLLLHCGQEEAHIYLPDIQFDQMEGFIKNVYDGGDLVIENFKDVLNILGVSSAVYENPVVVKEPQEEVFKMEIPIDPIDMNKEDSHENEGGKLKVQKLGKRGHYESENEQETLSDLKSYKRKSLKKIQPIAGFNFKPDEVEAQEGPQCSIMSESIPDISENLALPNGLITHKIGLGFLYANQEDAQSDSLSVVLEDNGIFELENKPGKRSFIQFITNDQYSGGGKDSGKDVMIQGTPMHYFGLKLTSVENMKDVLFQGGTPTLGKVYLPASDLAGGDITGQAINEFIRKTVNKIYGMELAFSSRTGTVKQNPNESFPVVKMFNFKLEKDKVDALTKATMKKFKIPSENTMVKSGKTLKSCVTLVITEESRKMRQHITDYLKTKAVKNNINQIGFMPKTVTKSSIQN